MKTSKLLILGMLVCVLCTTQTLGQGAPSVACGVAGYYNGTSSLALVAHEGDVLDYVVDVTNGPYPIENGVVTLTMPDGTTVVTLDTNLSLPAGGTAQYPVTFPPVPANQEYTVDSGDIGNNSAPANSVQALSQCVADAIIDPQTSVEVTGTGQWPTLVINPCVDVTKTVEPTTSKVGDEVEYTIEICNCGDTDLTLVEIVDELLGPIEIPPECEILAGGVYDGEELQPGECCTITVPYTIQPEDAPGPLENEVCVEYVDSLGGPAGTVTDCDTAVVDLVNPAFTVTKVCFNSPVPFGDDAQFEITITNTGDVDLIINTNEPDIPPDQTLPQGGPPIVQVVSRPVPVPGEEVCNTIVVTATLPPDLNLPNEYTIEATGCCETTPPQPEIDVTKEVDCGVSKEGDEVVYTICIKNTGPVTVTPTSVNDSVLGELVDDFLAECGDLEPLEDCCLTFPYVLPAGSDDPYPNTVTFEAVDESGQAAGPEIAQASVDLVHPSFLVSKSCRTEPLQVGDTAVFDIRIENDGDVCLRFDLTELGAPVQFDLAAGGVMEWETNILVETEEDITNTIIGTAILIPGDPPEECGEPTDCLDNILEVEASDICEVGTGATRTPGYWKTHSYMAECIFNECYPDGIDFGWTYVDSIEELMAIFHAKKAKLSKLCQARLQASFHFGAAILNDCVGLDFESFTGLTKEGVAETMAGCNVGAIKALIGPMADYNEFGVEVELNLGGLCNDLTAYNATPGVSKEWAGTVDLDALMAECEDCINGNGPTATGKGNKK